MLIFVALFAVATVILIVWNLTINPKITYESIFSNARAPYREYITGGDIVEAKKQKKMTAQLAILSAVITIVFLGLWLYQTCFKK